MIKSPLAYCVAKPVGQVGHVANQASQFGGETSLPPNHVREVAPG
jgi:hypothetical protein